MNNDDFSIPGAYLMSIKEHDGDLALSLLEIAQQYIGNGQHAGRIIGMRLVLDIEKGDEQRIAFSNLNNGPACSEIDEQIIGTS